MQLRQLRRSWHGIVAMAVFLAVLVVPSSPAAQACVCMLISDEQVVDQSESVFRFSVLEIDRQSANLVTVRGEVVEVFKGDVPEYISVDILQGTSCGSPAVPSVGATVGAVGMGGRFNMGGSCLPLITDHFLDRLYSPIEQPQAHGGDPAFLVSFDRPGARTAVISDRLQVSHFAPGRGLAQMMATCPGGRSVVELVTNDFGYGPVTVESRNLATLEVESVVATGLDAGIIFKLTDLACHNEAGQVFSYLVQRHPNKKHRTKNPERAKSVLELWQQGERIRLPADDAVAAVVDFSRARAFVLADESGDRVERWDLETATVEKVWDLSEMRGADLAVDAETGVLMLLAGKVDPKAKHAKGFMIRVEGDEMSVAKIEDAAKPVAMQMAGDRIYTMVKVRQQGYVIQVRDSNGTILEHLPTRQSSPAPLMAGNEALLMHSSFGGTIRLHPREGAEWTLDLAGVAGAIALPAGGLAQSIEVDDLPPVFTKSGRILPADPSAPLQPTSGALDLTWVFVMVGGLLAFMWGALLWKRRRSGVADSDR